MMATLKAGLALALLLLAFMGLKHGWFLQASTAVFDEKALTKHFITQLAERHVKNQKINETTLKFKRALRESLDFYRASHPHQLVLRKETVAFGGADITDTIAGRVAQTMKRAS